MNDILEADYVEYLDFGVTTQYPFRTEKNKHVENTCLLLIVIEGKNIQSCLNDKKTNFFKTCTFLLSLESKQYFY